MNIRCVITTDGGAQYTLTECIRFSLLRERYQPYAALHAELVIPDSVAAGGAEQLVPSAVCFYLGSMLLHDGTVQKAAVLHEQNMYLLRVDSRSYTAALMRNQMVPGMYYHVTLTSLLEEYHLPHITCDSGAAEVNYVLIKEHTGIWDAVIAFCYKYNRGYPYVRVPNLLCAASQPDAAGIVLPADAVVRCGAAGEPAALISRVDMADLDGTYGSFTMTNPEAVRRGIVNVKQIAFDRQFLYNPQDALRFRIACSSRRLSQTVVTYAGYCGEDIEDAVQLPDGQTAHVSRILLTGDRNGLLTQDSFYFDDFCNLPQP